MLQTLVLSMPEAAQNYIQPFLSRFAADNQLRRLEGAVENAAFIMEHIRDPEAPAVFVDCGFNNGLVMQSFIDHLPDDFDYYGFEVQEDLQLSAVDLLNANKDRQIMLTFAAVSDSAESVSYFPSRTTPWGGIFPHIATTTQRNRVGPHMDYAIERTAPGIDFSQWLSNLSVYYCEETGKKPFIAVKMNIEGAEYPVLQKVLRDGNLNKISILMAEFHAAQFKGAERRKFGAAHAEIMEAIDRQDIPCIEWK